MKKYLAFILALSLIGALFVGCDKNGGVDTDNETKEEVETELETEAESEIEIKLIDGFESTYLVPVMIKKERFESEILSKITDETERTRLLSFYRLIDISDEDYTDRMKETLIEAYPICEEFAIYVCETNIATTECQYLDAIIKKNCPDYTHKDLAYDSEMCGYTQEQVLEMRQIEN